MLSEQDRMYRAREGEAVYMECSVWPPATILWFRNYQSLNVEGERFQIFENGTLHIVDLRREDSNTYTCFAINNLNTGQLRAHLSVEVASDGEEEDEEEEEGDEEEDEEEDEDKEDEEEDEEDEEEGQDDGKEVSTSSPSAPNAGSGRDGGADDGEDDDDELLATSPAATTSSATSSAATTSSATTSAAATTSAGRASATSKASCCPGAAWATALLLTLVPSLARGGDV
ncbi:uncharacterized protein LOC142912330 [Petromyzon marinus]|uniref:uncharacterized protein LOC142912330 n=1 Tax=Petromyzon marinus TaxID=7757 RepID=UPI003F72929B